MVKYKKMKVSEQIIAKAAASMTLTNMMLKYKGEVTYFDLWIHGFQKQKQD